MDAAWPVFLLVAVLAFLLLMIGARRGVRTGEGEARRSRRENIYGIHRGNRYTDSLSSHGRLYGPHPHRLYPQDPEDPGDKSAAVGAAEDQTGRSA